MGNLEYSTHKATEYKIGEYDYDYPKAVDSVVSGKYEDVLLRSVNVWNMDENGEITWEYTFLKK